MTKTTTNRTDLVERARQLRLMVEQLERAAAMAKGTQKIRRNGNVLVKPSHGPYWVGDDGTTEELMTTLLRMLQDRPCRFGELLEGTGARDNRIKGCMVRLQREGHGVVNIGDGARALWFAPSDDVLRRLKQHATARR